MAVSGLNTIPVWKWETKRGAHGVTIKLSPRLRSGTVPFIPSMSSVASFLKRVVATRSVRTKRLLAILERETARCLRFLVSLLREDRLCHEKKYSGFSLAMVEGGLMTRTGILFAFSLTTSTLATSAILTSGVLATLTSPLTVTSGMLLIMTAGVFTTFTSPVTATSPWIGTGRGLIRSTLFTNCPHVGSSKRVLKKNRPVR